jgi:hypothetical protein
MRCAWLNQTGTAFFLFWPQCVHRGHCKQTRKHEVSTPARLHGYERDFYSLPEISVYENTSKIDRRAHSSPATLLRMYACVVLGTFKQKRFYEAHHGTMNKAIYSLRA